MLILAARCSRVCGTRATPSYTARWSSPTTYTTPWAVLGGAALGTFALGEGPSTRWISRASMSYTPTKTKHLLAQERSYDVHLAGREVCGPLRSALDFLRNTVG